MRPTWWWAKGVLPSWEVCGPGLFWYCLTRVHTFLELRSRVSKWTWTLQGQETLLGKGLMTLNRGSRICFQECQEVIVPKRDTLNGVHTPPRLESSSGRELHTQVSTPSFLSYTNSRICHGDEGRGKVHTMMITGIPTILGKQGPWVPRHQMQSWGAGQNPGKQRKDRNI